MCLETLLLTRRLVLRRCSSSASISRLGKLCHQPACFSANLCPTATDYEQYLDTSFRGNVPFLEVSDIYHREVGIEADVPGSPVEIEGVVEYKSLPSGLHNVSEDLV
jgi:hypothetical protein